jgi:hypothetical protein
MEKIIEPRDLEIEKQRGIVNEMLETINANDPTYYYMNTSDVADLIFKKINTPGALPKQKLESVKSLDRRAIQILLSYKKSA